MRPADLLGIVWESAPSGIEPHPWTQLVGGSIEHGSRRSEFDEIESPVLDAAPEQLPSLTKIPSVPAVLVIEQHTKRIGPSDWTSGGTDVVLGPVAEHLRKLGADKLDPRVAAKATQVLVETGDVSEVDALFSSVGSSKAARTRTHATTPHHNPETEAPTTTDSHAAANEVNYLGFGGLFATPPMSRLSAYAGRFGPDIVAVDRRTVCRTGRTVCRISGCSGREGRPLERLDTEKERKLLGRTPLGDVPRVSVPTEEVYEQIVEWSPVLRWAKPLAAILQLVLISDRRDDRFDPDLACTGMPLWHELVLAAFGFHSRQHAQKHGVNSGMLIELYRKHIDSDFHVSGWNSDKDLARVVLCHSIPSKIIEAVEEHMLGPEEPDSETYLINGNSANRRNGESDEHDRRVEKAEEQESEIPLPEFTERMQEYLHGYDRRAFSDGGYGFVSVNIDEAFEAARDQFQDAQRRQQVLRKLCMIRQYPMPLYPGCDFFPRLKAEGHNQLMNLPSDILRPIYTEKDREMDLSKAHLACVTPVAEKNGIDASLLREYLDRNRNSDFDLWMDIAKRFEVENMKAARTAAKGLYSAPYGGSKQEVVKQMCWGYADAGGAQHSFEPFKPALEHPLVDELFRMRGELKELIRQRGYLVDAAGRKIRPEMMTHKDEADRWKPVLAYTNASFEQKLMFEPFRLAIEEREWAAQKNSRRPKFRIWLYQADGITVRFKSDSPQRQIQRLQDAVAEKANELNVPTELEVDWPQ